MFPRSTADAHRPGLCTVAGRNGNTRKLNLDWGFLCNLHRCSQRKEILPPVCLRCSGGIGETDARAELCSEPSRQRIDLTAPRSGEAERSTKWQACFFRRIA